MKTQKLSHSISKFTPSLAIALLVAFAPYTSALPATTATAKATEQTGAHNRIIIEDPTVDAKEGRQPARGGA